MGYYLMVKEAVGTGIKYLCKCGDYKDPIKYKGSGVYWRRILAKHQCEIKTDILGFYETAVLLREAGEYYSKLFNIVEDKSWANLIPEIGDGGPTIKNKIRAWNPKTKAQKCFDDASQLPIGWIQGCPNWKKSRKSVERTRQAHIGTKRNTGTRTKMKDAWELRKLEGRTGKHLVNCSKCGRQLTIQNLGNHEKACNKS